MNHEEAQALWLLAHEGVLGMDQRGALDAHMATCGMCRHEVDRLAAADRVLREWGGARLPTPDDLAKAGPLPVTGRSWWPVALAAGLAGIALGLAGGFTAGRQSAPDASVAATPAPTSASLPQFVLMLEEPAAQWPPSSSLMRPGYFEWMDSLVQRGQYASGIRLAEDEGWYLPVGGTAVPAGARPASNANFSGFFVIRAQDYEEAVAIAQESPHLAYGGVLVRRTF